MAVDTEDDVLTPDQEEQRRRQIAGSIGTPVAKPGTVTTSPLPSPTIDKSQLPMIGDAPNMRPPEMPPSSPVTISGTAPIPSYPVPEQERAAQMEAQPYHLHGLARVADTIAGATPIGRAVEEAGGFGTYGHEARLQEQEGKAKDEQGREKEALAGQETQARTGLQEAQIGKTEAETDIARKNAENVTITDSQGHVIGNVPRGKAEDLIKAMNQIQGRQNVAETNVGGRQDVAETNVQGRRDVAEINAGKPQKPVQGTIDGKLAWGMYDPNSGWLNPETRQPIPNFTPPPNWSQGLTPVQIQSPTGAPEVGAFHRDTGNITPTSAISGSGTYAHQIEQAQALLRMVNTNVSPLVDQMAHKGEFGIIQGRFSDWLNTNIGNAPPDVAQFHQLMNGVVSMMMGMYGFRRQQAVEALTSQMGARMTPESLKGALKGITQHANSIIGGSESAPPAAQGGGLSIDRDANGRIIGVH